MSLLRLYMLPLKGKEEKKVFFFFVSAILNFSLRCFNAFIFLTGCKSLKGKSTFCGEDLVGR